MKIFLFCEALLPPLRSRSSFSFPVTSFFGLGTDDFSLNLDKARPLFWDFCIGEETKCWTKECLQRDLWHTDIISVDRQNRDMFDCMVAISAILMTILIISWRFLTNKIAASEESIFVPSGCDKMPVTTESGLDSFSRIFIRDAFVFIYYCIFYLKTRLLKRFAETLPWKSKTRYCGL